MKKRAISKHYFHWDPSPDGKIYDQRFVDKYLKEGRDPAMLPAELGVDYDDINTQILVYEDSVKTWFLDTAKYLTIKNKVNLPFWEEFDTNEAGFVIIQVAISYIEGNQQYREGETSKKKSKDFFRKAMKHIFPEICDLKDIDLFLNRFYEQVRCGLFHDGMTGRLVTINGKYPKPLEFLNSEILINPYKFLDRIIKDFEKYISELKDINNRELRENFKVRLTKLK